MDIKRYVSHACVCVCVCGAAPGAAGGNRDKKTWKLGAPVVLLPFPQGLRHPTTSHWSAQNFHTNDLWDSHPLSLSIFLVENLNMYWNSSRATLKTCCSPVNRISWVVLGCKECSNEKKTHRIKSYYCRLSVIDIWRIFSCCHSHKLRFSWWKEHVGMLIFFVKRAKGKGKLHKNI